MTQDRAERAAKRRERAERKKEGRRDRVRQERRQLLRRSIVTWGSVAVVAVLVIGGIIGGVVYWVTTSETLPPTKLTHPHTESLPPRQINSQPIPRGIQIHVMERNRTHPPGQMLVQYNCQDFQCEPDLIQKLTVLVQEYPPNVYLAPFPGMDAKIALAAPGRLEVLEDFNEGQIREFIGSNLNR